MLTRRSSLPSTDCFVEWTEPVKEHVFFSSIYPCIYDDPVQIYIRYHLGIKKTTNQPSVYMSSSSSSKKKFYMNNRHDLFFVSDVLSPSSFKRFAMMWASHHLSKTQICDKEIKPIGFFSIPLFHPRKNIGIMIDLIMSSSFLKQDSINTKYCMVFLTQCKKPTLYQQFQANFALMTLPISFHDDIDISRVFFMDPHSKSIVYDIPSTLEIQNKIQKYIQWVRICKTLGHGLTLYPPSHPFLYPNMRVVCHDKTYDNWKEDYAIRLGEISMLWKCPSIVREQMIKHHGVYSYHDPRFMDLVGNMIHDKRDIEIIRNLIRLQHNNHDDDEYMYIYEKEKISWLIQKGTELFVDFETCDDIIYWIGVGESRTDGSFEYTYFLASSLTKSAEYDVMTRFLRYINRIRSKKIYYWHAELRFWNHAGHNDLELNTYEWIDLCLEFRQIPVLIKNCYNMKLKNVVQHVKDITISPPDECGSGEDSILLAKRMFAHQEESVLEILKNYNYFDCRVMYDLVNIIRSKTSLYIKK